MTMLNSFQIYEDLAQSFDEQAAKTLTKTLTKLYEGISQAVTKDDFHDLKAKVIDLEDAGKRTDQRLDRLTEVISELAEAQKRTEARIEELTAAQRHTDEMVGGLADAVGYGIEDRLMPFIPAFVARQYGVVVRSVDRKFVTYADGRHDEINLLIEGEQEGKKVFLAGECKSRPGLKDLSRFDKVLNRLAHHLGIPVKGFLVGYLFVPPVEEALAKQFPQLDHFKTYEIERLAGRS